MKLLFMVAVSMKLLCILAVNMGNKSSVVDPNTFNLDKDPDLGPIRIRTQGYTNNFLRKNLKKCPLKKVYF